MTPGEDVEFFVEADGKDLSYKWHHKTTEHTTEVGGNSPTLHINNVTSADEGTLQPHPQEGEDCTAGEGSSMRRLTRTNYDACGRER